jgi:fermentation-respiration switch protein FrsA (DUF1100 family)
MRRDIEFDAEGTILRGWLYLPDGASGAVPGIVMAHGFSAVKEQHLDTFAEVFAGAGFGVLVFDNRNFGASDGEPRQEIDPVQQVRDYRHAITFIGTLPEIDAGRIGVWGTSYSGGHVLMVAAIDRRVKCVVSQVPTISGAVNTERRTRPDHVAGLNARFDADRAARFAGGPPATVPVVADNPKDACALPGKDSWDFFAGDPDRAPAWRNAVTLRSAEMSCEYEPGIYVPRISPTPLLMIVATHDVLTLTDLELDAFERAREPKKLVLIEGGHFTPYVDAFDRTSAAARDWFTAHLTR